MQSDALPGARVKKGRPRRGVAAVNAAAARREAERLAAVAGAFGLFGLALNVDQREQPPPPPALAEPQSPANDTRPNAFPALPRRGFRLSPSAPSVLVRAMDWLIAAAAAEAAALWASQTSLLALPIGQAWSYVACAVALKAGMWLAAGYRPLRRSMRLDASFGGLALGAFFALTVAMLATPDSRAASALSLAMPAAALLLAGLHASFAVLASTLYRRGVFAETVVIVGATEAGERLAARAQRTGAAHVVAVVDDRRAQAHWRTELPPLCGNIDDLLAWPDLPHVDRIIVAVPPTSPASLRAILHRLRCAPNRIDLLLDDGDAELHAPGARRLAGALVVSAAGRGADHAHGLAKRIKDLVLSALLLAILAAPMAAIALAIKLDSRGPALFRQPRFGKNGRRFTAYKFRTMHWAPGAPWRSAHADEARITSVGRWLRSFQIDDWPLLFNIIRGEMSLVGPRPHATEAQSAGCAFRDLAPEYPARHSVKPGLVGWAQMNGWREAPRTPACLRAQLKHDMDYIAHASLWLDLQLALRALLNLFGAR